jgi:hypothetical protein
MCFWFILKTASTAASSTGALVAAGSLQPMDPEHIRLVSAAMHILEALMEYSNPAGTWFRDLGGLNDTCQTETGRGSCGRGVAAL